MRTFLPAFLLIAIPALVAPAEARAQDLASVKAELDALEKSVDEMPPGDVGAANKIINSLNQTIGKLNKIKNKSDPKAHNEQALRANALTKKVSEKAKQKPDPAADGSAGGPARLTAQQKSDLGKVTEQVVSNGKRLEAADPKPFADEANLKSWRDIAKQYRDYISGLGGPDHPDLGDAYGKLAWYEKIIEDKIAAAKGAPPAAPASPTPGGAAPRTEKLSSAEKYQLKKFVDRFAADERMLARATPQTFAQPSEEKKFRDGAATFRAHLESVGPADHPELKAYYERLVAYEKGMDEKLGEGRGAVEGKRKAVQDEIDARRAALDAQPPMELADDLAARRYRNDIAGWRARLKELVPVTGAEALKPDEEKIAGFEKRLEERVAEGKKLVAEKEAREAQDVDGIVAKLDSSFDRENFSAVLEPPHTEDRVREWVKNLKQWEETKEKGFALLEKIAKEYPRFEKDPRVSQLRWWFQNVLPKKLDEGKGKLATGWSPSSNTLQQGEWPGALKSRDYLLDPKFHTEQNFANDGWVKDAKKGSAEAIEAGLALIVFNKEYLGKEDPEVQKKVDAYRALAEKLEGGAEAALQNSRLPAAGSTDPTLVEAAKAGLARGNFGAYERLVITAPQANRRKYLEWQGSTLYAYDFDEFWGATAENIDGDWRIVHYTWRYYRSGSSVTPLNTWVCSNRIVGRKILKENIAK